MLALTKEADSVELKLTVPESGQRRRSAALEMDPLEGQIRQVFFLDTPDLALDGQGVVVRARRVQGKGDDSVVKLRPVVPAELSPELRGSPGFGVEVDAMPGGYVCSASMKGTPGQGRAGHGRGRRRRCGSCSRSTSGRSTRTMRPEGVGLDDLSVLGPLFVLKLKFSPEQLDRRLVAELWLYPDGSRIFELSTKCAPREAFQVAAETRAFLAERGVSLTRRAADQDAQGARLLLGRAVERRVAAALVPEVRLLAAVGAQAVDDQQVHAEDRQRPERIGGDREQSADRAQARPDDPDPAPELAAGPDRERREQLDDADEQDDPAPGAEVLDDEPLVLEEEARLVDGGDSPDRVQDSGHEDHDAGEGEPPGSPDVVHYLLLFRVHEDEATPRGVGQWGAPVYAGGCVLVSAHANPGGSRGGQPDRARGPAAAAGSVPDGRGRGGLRRRRFAACGGRLRDARRRAHRHPDAAVEHRRGRADRRPPARDPARRSA